MKYFAIISLAFLGLFLVTCKTNKIAQPPDVRQLKPTEINSYHKAMELKIAWVPYENLVVKKTKKNNWVIVESDSSKTGAIPVILITYPESNDSVWVEMNTKSDLLGRLIKHSLMTQEPISQPYSEYFAIAKCKKCHPSNIKVDFDR